MAHNQLSRFDFLILLVTLPTLITIQAFPGAVVTIGNSEIFVPSDVVSESAIWIPFPDLDGQSARYGAPQRADASTPMLYSLGHRETNRVRTAPNQPADLTDKRSRIARR